MTKLDSISTSLTYSPASVLDPSTGSEQSRGLDRRLIVLVPEFELDTTVTAQKIYELANALEGCVQLLSLSRDAAHEPGLRRQLVALSAMLRSTQISVESKIELGNNWLSVVRSEWHEGDVIVCFAEQRTGFPSRPLNQILESNLKATVYVLSSFSQQEKRPSSTWLSDAKVWAGSIGIILGFLGLQLKLTQLPQDWTHTFLLYASIFAEAGTIWFWNSLFG